MCGIVGAATKRDVAGILIEGLQRLEYRGYDSAGLSVLSGGNEIQRMRRAGKVAELRAANKSSPTPGTVGIAHTRWATHGKPTEDNAHPHLSRDSVSVVHNGIIENHEELRDELKQAGYDFASETDTEVIAHLVHREVDRAGDFRRGVETALERLDGAYAVGVMHRAYPETIIGARLGSPLVVGLGFGENFIASDPQALRPVTDRFIFLEEGEIAEISAGDVSIFGLTSDNVPVQSRTVRLDDRRDPSNKGNFRHYMLKEIYEQPETVTATLEERITERRILERAFGSHAPDIFRQGPCGANRGLRQQLLHRARLALLDRAADRAAVLGGDCERDSIPQSCGTARHVVRHDLPIGRNRGHPGRAAPCGGLPRESLSLQCPQLNARS